jgi:predicted DNA binding CopG/RHH family protein
MTRAALYVRMTPAERSALDSIALEKGVSAASLLRAAIRSVTDKTDAPRERSVTDWYERKTERISIRVSESELKKLNEAARSLGTTRAKYIQACVRTALLRVPQLLDAELRGLEEAVKELRAVGRNLNQLARRMNEVPEIPAGLEETLRELQLRVKSQAEACTSVMVASVERWT